MLKYINTINILDKELSKISRDLNGLNCEKEPSKKEKKLNQLESMINMS
jgi:hypothetical protein